MSPKLLNLLLLSASFALYYVVLGPLYNGGGSSVWQPDKTVVALRDLSSQYDTTLDQADVLYKQAEGLRGEYSRVDDASRQKMLMMVPDRIDPVRLLSEVSNIAAQSGSAITGVTYAENVSTDPLRGAYTVTFVVRTSYSRFKEFIRNYENSLRLFTIKNVSFAAPQKDGDLISFQVQIETYYLK